MYLSIVLTVFYGRCLRVTFDSVPVVSVGVPTETGFPVED
jgi:hypothetical protein